MAAIFPGSVATSLQLLTAVNNGMVVLDADIGLADASIVVDDASALPASGYLTFYDTDEVIYYASRTGTQLNSVTRGADGTAAATHLAGVDLEMRWNADYHNKLATEIIAVEQFISDRFGIGTSPVVPSGKTLAVGGAADSKSLLTLTSTTLGFLPPRMTTTQRDAITSPTEGLRIYNTTTHLSNVYDGTAWRAVLVAGTASIVNADVATGAAIARSKLAALTISRAMVTDSSGLDAVSSVTATELGYLSGVTSAIQTQIGTLMPLAGGTHTGAVTFNMSSATSEPLIFTNSTNTQKGFLALNTAAASCEIDISTNRDAVTGTYNKTGQGSAYIALSSAAGAGSVVIAATSTNNGSPTTLATFTDAVNTFGVALRVPGGSTSVNSLGIGAANTGFYSAGSGQIQMQSLGTQVFGTDGSFNYSSVPLVTANAQNLGTASFPWGHFTQNISASATTPAIASTVGSSTNGTMYKLVSGTNSGSSNVSSLVMSKATGVNSSTATQIIAGSSTGLYQIELFDGAACSDIVNTAYGTFSVINSLNQSSMTARTYSISSGALSVKLAGGTATTAYVTGLVTEQG